MGKAEAEAWAVSDWSQKIVSLVAGDRGGEGVVPLLTHSLSGRSVPRIEIFLPLPFTGLDFPSVVFTLTLDSLSHDHAAKACTTHSLEFMDCTINRIVYCFISSLVGLVINIGFCVLFHFCIPPCLQYIHRLCTGAI